MIQTIATRSRLVERASDPTETVLVCPDCHGSLACADEAWTCSACGKTYPSLPGLVRIIPSVDCPQQPLYEQSVDILGRARASSWLDAILGSEDVLGRALVQEIIGRASGDWFPEVPYWPGMRALVIHSGWGQLAFYLGRQMAEVYSVEPVAAKAEFQQVRRRQQQADNVTIVHTQIGLLPFRAGSFDLIALTGALELIGAGDRSARQKEAQRAYLSRIRQLLTPEGRLYVSAKNRLGCWRAEDRSTRLRRSARTPGGYEALLRAAGFANTRTSWAWPSNVNPFQGALLKNHRALALFANREGGRSTKGRLKSMLVRAAAGCGMGASIMPDISIIASSGESRSDSLLETICSKLRSRQIPVSADASFRSSRPRVFNPSRSDTRLRRRVHYVLFDSKTHRPEMVVKIPSSARSAEWLKQEAQNFSRIAEQCPLLPDVSPVIYMQVSGMPILCEPFFPGRTFKHHLRSPHAYARVMKWLSAFQRASKTSDQTTSPLEYSRPLVAWLSAYKGVDREVIEYARQWLAALARTKDERVVCVPVHGDCSPENIMLSARKVFVTDWEWATPVGPPWHDVWGFLLSCALNVSPGGATKQADPANILASLEGTSMHFRLITRAVNEFLKHVDMSRRTLLDGLLSTLLWRIRRDLEWRGRPPDNSPYYQLLALAARAKRPLWQGVDGLLGLPERTRQHTQRQQEQSPSLRLRKRARHAALVGLRGAGVFKLYQYAKYGSVPILTFHGVAGPPTKDACEPLRTRLAAEDFERYIKILTRHFDIVHADDAVEMLSGRKPNNSKSLVLSFDDGYLNNATVVWPILKKYDAPATFFLPTGYIGMIRRFWADRLDYAVQHLDPAQCVLKVGWSVFRVKRSDREAQRRLFWQLYRACRALGSEGADEAVAAIEQSCTSRLADSPNNDCWAGFMTWEHVRSMRSEGARFGSHTVNHLLLDELFAKDVRRELADSKAELELKSGGSVAGLAYPVGRCTPAVATAAKEAGYGYAVSTREHVATANDPLMVLPRIGLPSRPLPAVDVLARAIGLSGTLSNVRRTFLPIGEGETQENSR